MSPPRIDYLLVCELPDVLSPEDVAGSLHSLGHSAIVTKDRDWSWSVFELAIDPNTTRVLVRVGEDIHGSWDSVTSDLEMLDDLVAERVLTEEESTRIRRFVQIGHWDYADRSTVEALVVLLCERMHARIIAYPTIGHTDEQ